MRQSLRAHRDFLSPAVSGIAVEIVRRGGALALRYLVTGSIDDLLLPPMTAPQRADELWRHTCFEAFVRPEEEEGYCELNFAPSAQWTAYRFDSYRSGMRDAIMGPPLIEAQSAPDAYELRATFGLPGRAPWRLGLAAVIEERNGRKSYWALTHPPGAPDFHHADCFALELPPPQSSPRT